jgi:hypothetical protein
LVEGARASNKGESSIYYEDTYARIGKHVPAGDEASSGE